MTQVTLPVDTFRRNVVLGNMLARARQERGWTQVYLAESLGVSAPYLSHVEHARKSMSLDTLSMACRVFGWRVEVHL